MKVLCVSSSEAKLSDEVAVIERSRDGATKKARRQTNLFTNQKPKTIKCKLFKKTNHVI